MFIDYEDGPYIIGISYDNDTDAYMLNLETNEFFGSFISID